MSVSREELGNQGCAVAAEEPGRDELVEVGEVSQNTGGGPEGGIPDLGAGYTWG
jgi:hypothetical protein